MYKVSYNVVVLQCTLKEYTLGGNKKKSVVYTIIRTELNSGAARKIIALVLNH